MSTANRFPGSADDAGLDAQALRATDPRQCQILNRKSKVQNEKNSSKTSNYWLYMWTVPMQSNRRFLFLNGGVCNLQQSFTSSHCQRRTHPVLLTFPKSHVFEREWLHYLLEFRSSCWKFNEQMRTLRSHSQLKAKLRKHAGPESLLQEERPPHSENATMRQSKGSTWLHRADLCWPSDAHELSTAQLTHLLSVAFCPWSVALWML